MVIPPQRNATLSQNSNTAMQERDRHIRAIERHGRREWYKLSGCTKRSMVENAVYRYKAIIGPERRCCTARSKSLTSLCRSLSHPAQYVSGIPSAVILLRISHPIRCSTRCLANVRVRISGPMIAL